jgi:anti-sigma regulatory factor (Ser/Thr protein kinase)
LEQKPADQPTRLCIRSDPGDLPKVREAVRTVAGEVGFDEESVARIVLAIDEALANVIKHGYEGRPNQPVEVCLARVRENGIAGLKLEIRDFGRQVDPQEICGRDLKEVRPGGLGVHIIRSVMDRVVYSPAEGGGMRLQMVKLKTP